MPSSSSLSFATFMVICPTSFFLGILFSLFPYDYPLLWSAGKITASHLDAVESHLRLLHASPNLIVRILHIVTMIGLAGLVLKLYKPTESNMLFDGGSLVLYMVAVVVYLTNIVKGLRIVSDGSYGLKNLAEMTVEEADEVDALGNHAETGYSILGREDNLKVLAASNTIAALVLVGVLVLQVGQWYAERVESKERAKLELQQREQQQQQGTGAVATTTTTTTTTPAPSAADSAAVATPASPAGPVSPATASATTSGREGGSTRSRRNR